MLKGSVRTLFLTLGFVCVVLGTLGIFLPLLPTTPFLILAAYLFSKSSTYFHQWLLNQPLLGQTIKDWEDHGMIAMKSKVVATVMMLLLFTYTLIKIDIIYWAKIFIMLIGLAVMLFIWSRPSTKSFEH